MPGNLVLMSKTLQTIVIALLSGIARCERNAQCTTEEAAVAKYIQVDSNDLRQPQSCSKPKKSFPNLGIRLLQQRHSVSKTTRLSPTNEEGIIVASESHIVYNSTAMPEAQATAKRTSSIWNFLHDRKTFQMGLMVRLAVVVLTCFIEFHGNVHPRSTRPVVGRVLVISTFSMIFSLLVYLHYASNSLASFETSYVVGNGGIWVGGMICAVALLSVVCLSIRILYSFGKWLEASRSVTNMVSSLKEVLRECSSAEKVSLDNMWKLATLVRVYFACAKAHLQGYTLESLSAAVAARGDAESYGSAASAPAQALLHQLEISREQNEELRKCLMIPAESLESWLKASGEVRVSLTWKWLNVTARRIQGDEGRISSQLARTSDAYHDATALQVQTQDKHLFSIVEGFAFYFSLLITLPYVVAAGFFKYAASDLMDRSYFAEPTMITDFICCVSLPTVALVLLWEMANEMTNPFGTHMMSTPLAKMENTLSTDIEALLRDADFSTAKHSRGGASCDRT